MRRERENKTIPIVSRPVRKPKLIVFPRSAKKITGLPSGKLSRFIVAAIEHETPMYCKVQHVNGKEIASCSEAQIVTSGASQRHLTWGVVEYTVVESV